MRHGAGRALAVYTLARLAIFLACLVVLYGLGMGLLWALIVAALLSGLVGYVLLAKQRLALSVAVADRVDAARARSAARAAREDPVADQLIADQESAPPAGGQAAWNDRLDKPNA